MESWELPDGTITQICPKFLVDEMSIMLLKYYRHYKNGVLPVQGGLLDQTAFYYDSMTFIERNL
jgi:hypothetical protein